MKVSEQCSIAASKGNQILGLIRRSITYMKVELILPLYKAMVTPHLEYCSQAWRLYCEDIIIIIALFAQTPYNIQVHYYGSIVVLLTVVTDVQNEIS